MVKGAAAALAAVVTSKARAVSLPRLQLGVSCAVVATAIFSAAGCGMSDNPYEKTDAADTRSAATRLAGLPTLEDSETQLRAAVVELGAYVGSLVPGLTWTWVDDRALESCDRPYDQTEGSKVRLQNYVSTAGIPDTVWPRILDRARQLAGPLGATGAEAVENKSGDHRVRLYSREGTMIFLGTQGAVISSNTGCRLPAAIKNPSPPPTSATREPR